MFFIGFFTGVITTVVAGFMVGFYFKSQRKDDLLANKLGVGFEEKMTLRDSEPK